MSSRWRAHAIYQITLDQSRQAQLLQLQTHSDLNVAFEIARSVMPRSAGDRYVCEKCGAVLVYEKGCPCPPGMPHSEMCCGEQMKKK